MATEVLTIGDLIAAASLDTKLLAGAGGVEREVLWAHSCEMDDPAMWLGPHELLMTVGLCVPVDPKGQEEFIARLDDAGLAGMMIGDHDPAPTLLPEMFAEADRRGFPVLLTGPRTPYAVIARHVAAANSSAQILQVLTLSKLYHLTAYADEDADSLVSGLRSLLRIGIDVVDPITGMHVLDSGPFIDDSSRSPSTIRSYPLRGSHAAQLVLTEFAGEELDGLLLVHLMKVLEVAVDRTLNAADRRSEVGEQLMLALLNGNTSPEVAPFIAPLTLSDGFQVVAFPQEVGPAVARLTASRRRPVLTSPGNGAHLAVVPVAAMSEFRALVEPAAGRAGISSVFTSSLDTRVAAVEAGEVLATAQHSTPSWIEFEGSAVSVLARSQREAREIVAAVLGPLAENSTRAASMRETLFAYLRNDRKWSETADELSIHRQTLSYRLGRIEAESGLDLSKSADISSSWIAYKAWRVIHPGGIGV